VHKTLTSATITDKHINKYGILIILIFYKNRKSNIKTVEDSAEEMKCVGKFVMGYDIIMYMCVVWCVWCVVCGVCGVCGVCVCV